jgi:hypothetical protein
MTPFPFILGTDDREKKDNFFSNEEVATKCNQGNKEAGSTFLINDGCKPKLGQIPS